MKIHPKTNELLEGIEPMRKFIEENKGIEIQYFTKNKDELVDFGVKNPIVELMKIFPTLEEITVHPPLAYHEIELFLYRNKDLLIDILKQLIELSNEYNIKINMILHTGYVIQQHKLTTLDDIKEIAKLLEGTKVTILFENMFMMYEKNTCSVLELCDLINSENVKVCFDICHLYCQATVWHMPIKEFIRIYLDKEKCKKHVKHIHFSATLNDDGYIVRSTHGRCHTETEKLFEDVSMLLEYGMDSKDINWVTEVSELDYKLRPDQIKELEGLTSYRDKYKI